MFAGAAVAAEANAGRREFKQWLRTVTPVISPQAMKTAIGQPTIVSVPCALLDLT